MGWQLWLPRPIVYWWLATQSLTIEVWATCQEQGKVPFGPSRICEAPGSVKDEAKNFIVSHMPGRDVEDDVVGPILEQTIDYAVKAKLNFTWAAEVTKENFLSYVVPYAEVNEPRTNWRELFFEKLEPLVRKELSDTPGAMNTTEQVVLWLNKVLWTTAFDKTISFEANRTPLVYDPLSVLAFGAASCTGVSIFFVNGLRTLGIPARMVGTPAWNGVDEGADNNHNWIEVLIDGRWFFLEAKPAGQGQSFRQPCDKWFCTDSKMWNTTVVASKWDGPIGNHLAWAPLYKDAKAEDRTASYREQCKLCGNMAKVLLIK